MRVLVVEDNQDFRESLCSLIEVWGTSAAPPRTGRPASTWP
jgi:hypothetical protein